MARKNTNSKTSPKSDEARAQREQKAAAKPEPKPEPEAAASEPKPVTELPNADVNIADLEKALVAQLKTVVKGVKPEKKVAYTNLTVGGKRFGNLYQGSHALIAVVKFGPRKDERIKVTDETEIPAAVEALATGHAARFAK